MKPTSRSLCHSTHTTPRLVPKIVKPHLSPRDSRPGSCTRPIEALRSTVIASDKLSRPLITIHGVGRRGPTQLNVAVPVTPVRRLPCTRSRASQMAGNEGGRRYNSFRRFLERGDVETLERRVGYLCGLGSENSESFAIGRHPRAPSHSTPDCTNVYLATPACGVMRSQAIWSNTSPNYALKVRGFEVECRA